MILCYARLNIFPRFPSFPKMKLLRQIMRRPLHHYNLLLSNTFKTLNVSHETIIMKKGITIAGVLTKISNRSGLLVNLFAQLLDF